MSHADRLREIFEAERALFAAEAALFQNGPSKALAEVLTAAVEEARGLDDRREASMRLARLADLCAQVPGPAMADALVRILDDDDPAVRVEAGEAMRDVAYERYAEIARAIERAIEGGASGPAMAEVPWILAEIGEPSARPLIERLLGNASADVVASAVEALAELGEPEAIPALEKLLDDEREVALDDGFEEETGASIGELAEEAIAALSGESPD